MTSNTNTTTATGSHPNELESICNWVSALINAETRESALLELCKKREEVPELAPLLWNSYGAIAALLQEICAIYPYINPPSLTAHQSNRVCNALALLQCLASHQDTRSDFLKANIPLYLYTFLNTNNRTRPFEFLRLTSLGVIGALVKTNEPEVIAFLLGSEIIPLCLVIMESGSELSKTVATFIMQKLLLDEVGLAYICQTYERFVHVSTVLSKMVNHLAKEQSLRLLKHVIRCYLSLSEDTRARDALNACLPVQLTDGTFNNLLEQDLPTKRCLTQLLRQVAVRSSNLPGGNTNCATTNSSTEVAVRGPGSSVLPSLTGPPGSASQSITHSGSANDSVQPNCSADPTASATATAANTARTATPSATPTEPNSNQNSTSIPSSDS